MTEYLIPLLGALAALVLVGWYCRRWGHADGYAEGYDLGRQKGLLEGAVVGGGMASPEGAGGTRPVIR
jgi:hypothetical protein